jgi:hypothetical protein
MPEFRKRDRLTVKLGILEKLIPSLGYAVQHPPALLFDQRASLANERVSVRKIQHGFRHKKWFQRQNGRTFSAEKLISFSAFVAYSSSSSAFSALSLV